MRIYLLIFICSYLFGSASAQEVIGIECVVSLNSNHIKEIYQISSTKEVRFSIDQTQLLTAFSGYYWIGNKKSKIKKKHLDITADLSNVNNPTTYYSFQFPKGKQPTKVEYQYEVTRHDVMYLSSFKFEGTKDYYLKIAVPNHYQITYQNDQAVSVNNQTLADTDLYEFTKPFKSEAQSSDTLQLMIHPKAQTPNEFFINWYLRLLENQQQLSTESKNIIDAIVAQGSNQKEKAELYFEFIQNQINYYGHETGIEMVQPEDVDKVLLNRYGDCKDLALLLYSGLQYLGCESYFGLLNLIDNPTDTYFLSSFNHAIGVVKFDNELFFLDATDKNVRFGRPSGLLVNKKILMLSHQKKSQSVIVQQ